MLSTELYYFRALPSSNLMPMRLLSLASLFAVALAVTPLLRAQEAPAPMGPPKASDAPAPVNQGQELQTLKDNVNLVNLYFSVRDHDGYIVNLRKDDFPRPLHFLEFLFGILSMRDRGAGENDADEAKPPTRRHAEVLE